MLIKLLLFISLHCILLNFLQERIRIEIMDKEEHDRVEATKKPTTTPSEVKSTTTTTHVPKDNELDPIDNNEVEIDDNGIKLGSGTYLKCCSACFGEREIFSNSQG
jgi:hypothetical protein